RLFRTSALVSKDEFEEKLEKHYSAVMGIVNGLSEREAHDALNQTVCKSMQLHEEVSLGLLYIILTDPAGAPKAYRDLSFITRDSLGMVIAKVIGNIADRFAKLHETARTQLIWLTSEFVKNSVIGTEGLCHALLRQIVGGDISPPNVWLTESMLNLLITHRTWLEKNSVLLATAVYCYLRLIHDHEAAPFKNLKAMEVEFCISMLREKFSDCIQIGRDLVRLLQSVGRIPEFQALWRDMLHKPQSLSPQFTGLSQLMRIRTSRKFLACRLTPEMENKMLFLTSKVKFGQQKRYQDWFHRMYLSSPESRSLIPDLIRFIVGVVHPSNEVLCSDIIPRWAIIGWLLTSCQTAVASANSKLALFYDWLFYQPDKDNIMNIEPAILLMHHSIKSHPAITKTLLDFICRLMSSFCPSLEKEVRQGVRNGFRTIQKKKVVMSLSPVLDNPKMERDLKILVRKELSEFLNSGPRVEESTSSTYNKIELGPQSSGVLSLTSDPPPLEAMGKEGEAHTDSGVEEEIDIPDEEAVFSDPEDEDEAEPIKSEPVEKYYEFKPISKDATEEGDLSTGPGGGVEAGGEERESSEDINELEELESLSDELKEMVLNFLIFRRNICALPTHDVSRERFLTLLSALNDENNKFAYHFLFYLKASASDEERLTMYEDFASASRGERSLQGCLIEDLKVCQEYDPRAFRFLIPSIYRKFSEHVVGDSEVLHMLVCNMEPRQLNEFICEITMGELVIFGEEQLDSLIESTLDWESFEQYCVWQLIQAEDVLLESIVSILPQLHPEKHAEALANLLIIMKSVPPSVDLLTPVLEMDCSDKRPGNQFTCALLKYWSQEHARDLAQLVSQHVCKQLSGGKKRK
ncbi:predicted protein, partial [Nematostella vectensis]